MSVAVSIKEARPKLAKTLFNGLVNDGIASLIVAATDHPCAVCNSLWAVAAG